MMAGYIFLLLNGYELTAPEDDIVNMASGLAMKYFSLNDLENWLCYWSRELDSRQLCHPNELVYFISIPAGE